MIFYLGNTDYQWYKYLSTLAPEDINFWQPGGKFHFHAIESGAPFLLRLKTPINKIAGIGFFSSHSLLPIDFAWEVFQERNGVDSLELFKRKINKYRSVNNSLEKNPIIGCLILTNPLFFKEEDWLSTPLDWSPNIVQGKTYDSEKDYGKDLWGKIEGLLAKYRLFDLHKELESQFVIEESQTGRYGSEVLTRVRLGQGAFRVLITDSYQRKCAISGERTLPVLEAAHIKPYEKSGPHLISNGMLLRSDIHTLFDKGYLTITNQYKIEVSPKIKEEFENGREYYKFHGKDLLILPHREIDKPSLQFIDWHNNYVFRE
jgi:putative restriction endonuclease